MSKYTGTDGTTFLSAGKGDMIVWASKDGQFGFAKATFGKDKSITIKLDYNEQNMPKEADLDHRSACFKYYITCRYQGTAG